MAPLRTTVVLDALVHHPLKKTALYCFHLDRMDSVQDLTFKPVDFKFFTLALILACIYSDFSCLIVVSKEFFPAWSQMRTLGTFFCFCD